ncbi:MAG TPA: hypothetical protein VFB21_22220 [Chthonomonadaceae bacterium]|nr:hypothetical protein [Chthonomonadaceae bacterium]
MNPDYPFVAGGVAALAISLYLLCKRSRRQLWQAALLWACLGAGLMIQGFAPHLPIEGKYFVIPQRFLKAKTVRVDKIVDQERRMQNLSALLTGLAAVGLGVYYRHLLFPRRPEQTIQKGEPGLS